MSSNTRYPAGLEELIELLRTLPGIGRRAAERSALAMLRWDEDKRRTLGNAIAGFSSKVGFCPRCGAVADAGNLCAVCADSRRDCSILCVVEDPVQLYAVEKSGSFHGLYHVLGGRLSPLAGENGENMTTEALLKRASSPECKEVILALGADVEGRATGIFLAELLKGCHVKVSRPALGLPAGSGIGYADAATISAALDGRRDM